MGGNVFEVQGERPIRGKSQCQDTLDALELYAGEIFHKDAAFLQPLFIRLERSQVPLPEPPRSILLKRDKEEKVV